MMALGLDDVSPDRQTGAKPPLPPQYLPPGDPPMTRKRTASIAALAVEAVAGACHSGRPEDAVVDGAVVCLCPPEQKIPRPRNSFILYRQHKQGEIVTLQPGISNPQISKIIGQKWSHEPESVRNYWKKLAEEEKQQHKVRYPDYKYQPRRGGEKDAVRHLSPSTVETGHCPKCGGRPLATPRSLLKDSNGAFSLDKATPQRSSFPDMSKSALANLNTPYTRYEGYNRQDPSIATQPQVFSDLLQVWSPSSTQPRDNSSYFPRTLPPSPSPTKKLPLMEPNRMQRPVLGEPTAPRSRHADRSTASDDAPQVAATDVGTAFSKHEPPVASGGYYDESLRLAPIRPSGNHNRAYQPPRRDDNQPMGDLSASVSTAGGRHRERQATIMGIPFMKKMQILSQISQPLPLCFAPRPSRGPFIAIEGANALHVRQVNEVLEHALESSGGFDLWNAHDDSIMGDVGFLRSAQHGNSSESRTLLAKYLQLIIRWHSLSQRITDHISGLRDGYGPQRRHPSSRPTTGHIGEGTSPDPLPVAMASGFRLTISDQFACATPVVDEYEAVDHWRWMATQWRGIVGPDLVVYVKPFDDEEWMLHRSVEMAGQGSHVMVVRLFGGHGMDEALGRHVGEALLRWLRSNFLQDGSWREGDGREGEYGGTPTGV